MDSEKKLTERHHELIRDAALSLIAVADDAGVSLIDVIAAAERLIVEDTKVGDARVTPPPAGRRGYTLIRGRLFEWREGPY